MARTTGAATDLITFSRASSGTALTKVAYGPELVTNGTFDTDLTGWETTPYGTASDWSVVNGQAVCQSSTGLSIKTQAISVEIGSYYEVSGNSDRTTELRIGSTTNFDSGINIGSNNGNFVQIIQATNVYLIVAMRTDTTGTYYWDNISVRKVTYNSPTGTLKLISHPTNKPRVEYDANGVAKGLLIEEARTNYNPQSDNFSLWTKANITENNGLVTTTAVSGTHRISRTFSGFSGPVVSWADMKFGTHRYIQIYDGASTANFATFDLVEGTVTNTGANTTAFISQVGAGVYRCAVAYGNANPANGNTLIGFANGGYSPWGDNSFNADGTETVFIYRHQIEQGAFPTSYIPTSGATATRSADIASVSVSEFGYNQAQGSVVVEFSTADISTTNELALSDGTNNNRIMWGLNTAAGRLPYISSGGVNTVALVNNTGIQDGVASKAAIAFAANDVASSLDGQAVATDTSATIPSAITTLYFLGANGVDNQINGHIKSINYYPLRLSDAKLQSLTS